MTGALTMSADEFAEAFGVGVDLVYAAMTRGELPEVRIGRRRVIPRAAADRLIERAMATFDPEAAARALGQPATNEAPAESEQSNVQAALALVAILEAHQIDQVDAKVMRDDQWSRVAELAGLPVPSQLVRSTVITLLEQRAKIPNPFSGFPKAVRS